MLWGLVVITRQSILFQQQGKSSGINSESTNSPDTCEEAKQQQHLLWDGGGGAADQIRLK